MNSFVVRSSARRTASALLRKRAYPAALKMRQTAERAFFSQAHVSFEWIWNQVKVPKGFENFFPKGSMPPKKSDQKKDEDKRANGQDSSAEKKTEKRDEASSSSEKEEGRKQRQGFGGSGGGDQNNNQGSQQPEQIGGLLALLLIVLGVRSFQESEERSGSEITFSDFRQLLTLQQVERMVVVNKKMARVHLKPGAIGLMHVASESAFTEPETTSTAGDADWNDGTQMEWGGRAASVASSGASTSGRVASFQGKTLTYHFYFGSVESLEEKLTKTQQELGIAPRDYLPLQYVSETNWVVEVIKASPAIAMVGLTLWLFRGGGASAAGRNGGIFQIGKSNAKKINKEDINVTFKDVAGCDEAKKEIMEFVDFLQDSSRFTKLGAKIPKGALLYGPPGTGKTLLAKAVAGEASVPFFSVSGSDFLEMFVGVGPSRVRDLFKEARANAPCIVFIDEIDAVGRQRGRGGFSGGNDERENTLNQLLVEMDGFSPTTGVVVLAGTNRVDILDQALTRPGRFDRQIVVDKPDLQGRREIFRVHLKGITLEDDMDDIAGRLAGLTPGFAGADIANICNEAAIVAARRQADAVSMVDFEKAIDRVIGGLESNKIMSEEEKSIVAYHEAGHAIAGWFLEHADPLLKVTIIPRTSGALGFAQYLPKEIFLRSQDQIMDIVCMALAGRASEQVFFGRVTTGASDDLRRVTDIVYSMIHTYGMNSRVGQLAFPRNDNGMPGDKPYSDATAEAMDEEARSIVDAAYQRTVDLIMQHKAGVEKVALKLLDQETITHDDIVELVGPRPFEGDDMYKEYVSHKSAVNKRKEQTNKEEAQDEKHDVVPDEGLTPELA